MIELTVNDWALFIPVMFLLLVVIVSATVLIFAVIKDRKKKEEKKDCNFKYHNEYIKHFGRCTNCGSRYFKKQANEKKEETFRN